MPRRRRPLPRALALLLPRAATLAARPRPVTAAHPFVDVPPGNPAAAAIDQRYNRGVIRGYPTTPPTSGPGDTSRRARMAALLGRAMAWPSNEGTNPFADRCNPAGCVDKALWGHIATPANRDLAKGYTPTTNRPLGNVLQQPVILLIARAKVRQGAWAKQPDNPRISPGAAGGTADHQDIVTYGSHAGAPPDAPTTYDTAGGDSTSAATRGWFARAPWRAHPEGAGPPLTGPTGGLPPSPNTAAFIADVLTLTDAQRQQHGCGPLTADTRLRDAAQKHAADMAVQDYLSHTGPQGSTPDQRIAAEGYAFRTWAENIAAGQTTPPAVMNTWMNSQDGHRENILNCGLTQIGIGHYFLAADGGTTPYGHYWVQVFARPQ